MKLYRDPGEAAHRPQILTLLCLVVGVFSSNQFDNESQNPLTPYKDDILSTFVSGLQLSANREASLEGLKKVSLVHDFLSEEELVYAVHNISEILQSDSGDDSYDAR